MRLSVAPPEKTNVTGTPALSPDGRRIAIVASDASGVARLWIRPVDSLAASPVVGTEGARYPFWSPDGNSIAFFADGKLRRVALAGGAPQVLCDISDFRGGAWGRNGDILFTPGATDPLYRIADTGGPVVRVTSLDVARQGETHRWPFFLPDGRHFLCLVVGQATGIYMGSLDAKELKPVVKGVMSAPVFAPPGHLLYVNQSTLVTQRFDPRRGEVSGDPIPVAEGIWRDPTIWGLAAYSASTTGLLAYRPGSGEEMQFTWFDRTGKSLGAIGPLGIFAEPWLSPDEKKIAVGHLDRGTGRQDIWIHDLIRGSSTRLTFGSAPSSLSAVWSPDGRSVVYSGVRGPGWAILRRNAAGEAPRSPLVTAKPGLQMDVDDWSADGRLLIYEARRSEDQVRPVELRPEGPARATDPGDGIQRDACATLARRAVPRLRLRRNRPRGSVRSSVSCRRREVARLLGQRRSAPVATRRQGALLRRARSLAHGRRRHGGRAGFEAGARRSSFPRAFRRRR